MSNSTRSNKQNKSKHPQQSTSKKKSNSLQCLGCKQIFSSKAQLIKHHQFSSDKRCNTPHVIHSCSICGKQFISEKTLHHHMRSSSICHAATNPDFLSAMDIPSCSAQPQLGTRSIKEMTTPTSSTNEKSVEVVQETCNNNN